MRPFFEAKFGGPDAVTASFERVSGIGRDVGIAFDFDAMPKAPNTRLAHVAVLSYDGDPRQRAVLLSLYSAYFEQGRDITDRAVIAAVVAATTGEPASAVDARLDDVTVMAADLEVARALGVDGVPLFVADAGDGSGSDVGLSDAAIAVSGAQPARTLAHLLEQARERAAG